MPVDVDTHLYEGFSFNYNFHGPVRKLFEKDYHLNSIMSFCTYPINLGKVFILGILLDTINLFIGLQVKTIVAVFDSSIGTIMQKVTFLLERQLFPSNQVHTSTSEIDKYPTCTLHRLP